MLTYISNTDHYKDVLSRVQSVKHMLWIGIADIKDLYIEMGKEKKPFWDLIALSFGVAWRYGLFMLKNPVKTSEKILTSTLYSMTVWSEYYVRVYISKLLCSTEKRYMLEVRKRLRGSTYEIKSKRLVSFGLLISLFPHVWKQFPIFL